MTNSNSTITAMFYLSPIEIEIDTITISSSRRFFILQDRTVEELTPTGFRYHHPNGQVDIQFARSAVTAGRRQDVLAAVDQRNAPQSTVYAPQYDADADCL